MNINSILRSVVTVRSSIPEDAFTAATLGIQREGSGVVIREDGLVLTIGYLITEAEDVWVTGDDGLLVPAHALAYDQETGFASDDVNDLFFVRSEISRHYRCHGNSITSWRPTCTASGTGFSQ